MDALEETPKDAMDVLEDLMSKRKWKKQCLRANVAQPEDIVTYGTVKVAKIYSNVLNKREKEPELYDAIKDIAPEWWGEDTQITLNRDVMCMDPVARTLLWRRPPLRRRQEDTGTEGVAQDRRTHTPLERPS